MGGWRIQVATLIASAYCAAIQSAATHHYFTLSPLDVNRRAPFALATASSVLLTNTRTHTSQQYSSSYLIRNLSARVHVYTSRQLWMRKRQAPSPTCRESLKVRLSVSFNYYTTNMHNYWHVYLCQHHCYIKCQ